MCYVTVKIVCIGCGYSEQIKVKMKEIEGLNNGSLDINNAFTYISRQQKALLTSMFCINCNKSNRSDNERSKQIS